MSLTDVVSHAGYAAYAEIALVLFFLAFLGVAFYLWTAGTDRWERARQLPLCDDSEGSEARLGVESSEGDSR